MHDIVITIDDDLCVPPTLVQEAKKHIHETNISYNLFKDLTFEYDFSKPNFIHHSRPSAASIRYRFLGCSMICPDSFPVECLDQSLLETRRRVAPKEDQSYIKAFMVKNQTPISFLDYDFKQCSVASLSNNPTCNCFLKFHNGIYIYGIINYM